jgi:catechol 2,3-dioxygenase-like lactoylglutathione lyase family enzyme
MSPADRPLQSATLSHFGLSVGDLDAMAAFYARLGFDAIARSDFAPAPVRLALVRNQAGITLELTSHRDSAPAAPAASAMEAAKQRGVFQYALRVTRLEQAVAVSVAAGARLLSAPAANSSGEYRFAYIADPEGNLIEFMSPLPHPDKHP